MAIKSRDASELLAKRGYTVTPAKAGVQKSLKNLDSVFRRNDEREILQKALLISFLGDGDLLESI